MGSPSVPSSVSLRSEKEKDDEEWKSEREAPRLAGSESGGLGSISRNASALLPFATTI
jgi:hypothetical protein